MDRRVGSGFGRARCALPPPLARRGARKNRIGWREPWSFRRSAAKTRVVRTRLSPPTRAAPLRTPLLLVGEGGFGPPKSETTDLQSAPFGHSGIPPYSVGSFRNNRIIADAAGIVKMFSKMFRKCAKSGNGRRGRPGKSKGAPRPRSIQRKRRSNPGIVI